MKIDVSLIVIAGLLAVTILLFVLDVFPYPFGITILMILLALRVMAISSNKN